MVRFNDESKIIFISSTVVGWRTPERVLAVRETSWSDSVISESVIREGNCSIVVESLEVDKAYEIVFYPRGPNIAPEVGQKVYRYEN